MLLYKFPDNFLWGAATSSHQIEGNNFLNDWYEGEVSEKVPLCGIACDSYHRYKDDIVLLKEIGCNAYRFSLEWSRICPTKEDIDYIALEHYKHCASALLKHNIVPVITINHFTLPKWFLADGGWQSRESVHVFTEFTDLVSEYFRDSGVKYWITLNEPLVYIFNSYISGIWPPFVNSDIPGAYKALENLKKAHFCAYHAIKHFIPDSQVSMAKHYRWFRPCSCRVPFFNKVAAFLRDLIFNHDFTEFCIHNKCIDFLSVNYYTGEFVKWKLNSPIGDTCSCKMNDYSQNTLGWFNAPDEFTHALLRYKKSGLPIIITENGTTAHTQEDYSHYLTTHLKAVVSAMQQGADIKGFFYWSLMDNYEWAEGYNAKFGLADINRNMKEFSKIYSGICKSNSLNIDD